MHRRRRRPEGPVGFRRECHGARSDESALPPDPGPGSLHAGSPSGCARETDIDSRRGRAPGIRSCSDRKSTRLNSSHVAISYAVFCLKKKKKKKKKQQDTQKNMI